MMTGLIGLRGKRNMGRPATSWTFFSVERFQMNTFIGESESEIILARSRPSSQPIVARRLGRHDMTGRDTTFQISL